MAFKRHGTEDAGDKYGFVTLEDETPEAIVASVCARGGHGKTDLACSAPGPIVYLSTDPNNKGVIRRWQREHGKEFHFKSFTRPAQKVSLKRYGVINTDEDAKAEAGTQWSAFVDIFTDACRGAIYPKAKTIIVDTATEMRQIQTLSHFGKLIQIPKNAWTIPNVEYAELCGVAREAQERGVSVILLHKLKEEYKDTIKRVSENGAMVDKEVSEKTGVWIRDGYNKTEFLVDVEVHLFKDIDIEIDDADPETVARRFSMTVTKCTERPAIEGKTWRGVTKTGERRVSFPFLATKVFPTTSLESWR